MVYGIGLIRTKMVAVLLGPSGVGLVGMLGAVVGLASVISGLGLQNSGVREISAARGLKNAEKVGQLQLALRRLTWMTGLLGAAGLMVLAPWISRFVTGNQALILPILLVASVLFLKGINIAQIANIQGHRRVGVIARISIVSAVGATIFALIGYSIWGEVAVPIVLVLTTGLMVAFAFRASKRLWIAPSDRTWTSSRKHWKRLVELGSAVAWGALLAELIPFFARSLIVREAGMEANGIYMAAWGMSGLFATFVLSAMNVDYFPRLSEAAVEMNKMHRLANEQTEIGILLVLPGIVVATAFAPIAIQLLYTAEFLAASELLKWFLLGVLGRVVNWPAGMIVLAHGHSLTFAVMQSISVPIHLALIWIGFNSFGLEGAAMAFGIQNILYGVFLRIFLGIRYRFNWNHSLEMLFLNALLILLATTLVAELITNVISRNILLTLVCLLVIRYNIGELSVRLSDNASTQVLLDRIPPLAARILGIR